MEQAYNKGIDPILHKIKRNNNQYKRSEEVFLNEDEKVRNIKDFYYGN